MKNFKLSHTHTLLPPSLSLVIHSLMLPTFSQYISLPFSLLRDQTLCSKKHPLSHTSLFTLPFSTTYKRSSIYNSLTLFTFTLQTKNLNILKHYHSTSHTFSSSLSISLFLSVSLSLLHQIRYHFPSLHLCLYLSFSVYPSFSLTPNTFSWELSLSLSLSFSN